MSLLIKIILLSFLALALSQCSSTGGKLSLSGYGGEAGDVYAKNMAFDHEGSDSGKYPNLKTVNFEYDSAQLTTRIKNTLNRNAQWIKDNKVKVQIEGHCDKRGSVEYNLSLGQRRASAVKNYLLSQGVKASMISTISYGKERPLALGDSGRALSENRRTNFLPEN